MTRIPLLTVLLFCVGINVLAAEPAGTWEQARSEAEILDEKGDCAAFWKLVWPWAKERNSMALVLLASRIRFGNLVLPGDSGDRFSTDRHTIIMLIHSDPIDPDALKFKHEILESYTTIFLPTIMPALESYIMCMKQDKSMASCVNFAVESGLVPNFDDYVFQIEALSNYQGSKVAICKQ